MARPQGPIDEQLAKEISDAIFHFAEFIKLGLAYYDQIGNWHFLPLCNDGTELVSCALCSSTPPASSSWRVGQCSRSAFVLAAGMASRKVHLWDDIFWPCAASAFVAGIGLLLISDA